MIDGTRLKRLRLERTMTQRELAAKAGITHDAISMIEHGKRQGRPSTVRKLAEALGVEPREILRPEEPR